MKIMIREEAALLAAGHLPALACPAPVRVLAPEAAEEELDVPRSGYISAISAMILNIHLGMMSWKKKRQAMEDERKGIDPCYNFFDWGFNHWMRAASADRSQR
jgi:hypothetical protein